jgi:hypothetical protein
MCKLLNSLDVPKNCPQKNGSQVWCKCDCLSDCPHRIIQLEDFRIGVIQDTSQRIKEFLKKEVLAF